MSRRRAALLTRLLRRVLMQACCIRSGVVVALKVYPKVRVCVGRGHVKFVTRAYPHACNRHRSRCRSLTCCRCSASNRFTGAHCPQTILCLGELNDPPRSRLHHANVLELYAVFEDADAFYFVMQCVPPLVPSVCVTTPACCLTRCCLACRYVPRGDLFHELKRCGGCFSERSVRSRTSSRACPFSKAKV
jgi:hypothetical protein